MLTTRDAGLAELADRLRNHGAGIPEEGATAALPPT